MLFAEERQSEILKMLQARKKLLVSELSAHFNVTQATIRLDLGALEKKGKLRRAHGGAILPAGMNDEHGTDRKMIENAESKRAIASAAAQTVSDGDTIIIDTGTTPLFFARALEGKKNLKIVTNDLLIASYLEEHSDFSVMLLGGEIRRHYRCTYGPMLADALSKIRADVLFLAINGVSAEHGLTTPDYGVAQIKRSMMAAANKTVLLADGTKFAREHFAQVCRLDEIDTLITDASVPDEIVSACENAGVEIIAASLPKS